MNRVNTSDLQLMREISITSRYIGNIYDTFTGVFEKIKELQTRLCLKKCDFQIITPNRQSIKLLLKKNEENIWIEFRRGIQPSPNTLRAGIPSYQVILSHIEFEGNEESHLYRDILSFLNIWCNSFSKIELKKIRQLNPLLYKMVQMYKAEYDLRNICLIIRDHLLIEKLNLINAFIEAGLHPGNCWYFAKEDSSLYSINVSQVIKDMGINLLKGTNRNKIGTSLEAIVSKLSSRRIIVLDDGADIILPLYSLKNKYGLNIVNIETTSKGVNQIKKSDRKIDFVNLANCSIKDSLSLNIAVSCVTQTRNILMHDRLANEDCLVLGYGKLGRHISKLLSNMGVNISVADPDSSARERAVNDGFKAYLCPRDALQSNRFKYFFGCSGTPSMNADDVEYFNQETILVTASSQDFSLIADYLKKNFRKQKVEGIGDLYTTKSGKKIVILAHGHAINLYYSEGVSEPEYDRFTALLFVTVMNAAKMSHKEIILDVEDICKSLDEVEIINE